MQLKHRTYFHFLLSICVILSFTLSVTARAQQLDSAKAVEPDEEIATLDITITAQAQSESMEEARKSAIVDGQRRAFYMALTQLAPTQARDIYRKLRGKDLSVYLVSFMVNREVKKAGSYEADIIYRFDKAKLEEITRVNQGLNVENEIPQGEGLLIVAPYDTGDALILFERANIWRAILANVALEVGQGSLVVPFGDPRDVRLLTQEVLLSADEKTLASLARRYGTRHVVIAFARSRIMDGLPVIEVILRKAGGKAKDEKLFQYKARSAADTLDVMLATAAQDISLKLKQSMQDFSLFGDNEADKLKPLVMRVEFDHLQQWQKMRHILEALPGLQEFRIGALSVNYAQVTILYKGSEGMIQQALLSQGLIVDNSQEYWVISQNKGY